MDYKKIYVSLTQRAKTRNSEPSVYYEKHHVVPRCLGGDDSKDNLTLLTPEEHYVAHQLLVKLNPGHAGIAYAAHLMTIGHGARSTNKLFGWLRRRLSEAKKGVPRPPHVIEILRQSNLGKKRGPMASEIRLKISEAKKGKPMAEETKRKLSAINTGNKHTEESCRKMSASHKGVPKSPEHVRKVEESKRRNRELNLAA